MKKYLNSPEQLIIALKLGKVVYREKFSLHYKMLEGIICAFDKEGCVWANAQIIWTESELYVIEK